MTARQGSTAPAPGPARSRRPPAADRELAARLPRPGEAARLAGFLSGYPGWSVFWDKRSGVWRAAEDDPGSGLYTESPDLDRVLGYITAQP